VAVVEPQVPCRPLAAIVVCLGHEIEEPGQLHETITNQAITAIEPQRKRLAQENLLVRGVLDEAAFRVCGDKRASLSLPFMPHPLELLLCKDDGAPSVRGHGLPSASSGKQQAAQHEEMYDRAMPQSRFNRRR